MHRHHGLANAPAYALIRILMRGNATTPEDGKRSLALKNAAVEHFQGEHWLELSALTGRLDAVRNHDRLLRSLSWGDPDYGTHAFSMLTGMVEANPSNLGIIDEYITGHFQAGGVNVSSVDTPGKRIYFNPSVFQTPSSETEPPFRNDAVRGWLRSDPRPGY
jgi:hypothetical protein